MKSSKEIIKQLDKLYPDARCELVYSKDYELLIATVLSAQCTDKRVNSVTSVLFAKYDIFDLNKIPVEEIERIIYPVGTHKKKAKFIKAIAAALVENFDGRVPNNRDFLEALPGVGRKTCNVVLSNLYNIPAIAVDTHVSRVSNRLGLVNTHNVSEIERELMNFFPKENWSSVHHQLVLFGRYICKSSNPDCENCPFHCGYNKTS